jgi:hypothetical protein
MTDDRVRRLLRTRQIRGLTDEPLSDATLDALADVARWTGSSRTAAVALHQIGDAATLRRLAEEGRPKRCRSARRLLPSRSSS